MAMEFLLCSMYYVAINVMPHPYPLVGEVEASNGDLISPPRKIFHFPGNNSTSNPQYLSQIPTNKEGDFTLSCKNVNRKHANIIIHIFFTKIHLRKM